MISLPSTLWSFRLTRVSLTHFWPQPKINLNASHSQSQRTLKSCCQQFCSFFYFRCSQETPIKIALWRIPLEMLSQPDMFDFITWRTTGGRQSELKYMWLNDFPCCSVSLSSLVGVEEQGWFSYFFVKPSSTGILWSLSSTNVIGYLLINDRTWYAADT